MKDHIRECAHCQSKRGTDDGSGQRSFSRPGRRKTAANSNEEEEEEEEEGEENVFFTDSSQQQRSKMAKGTPKHELVFVSIRGLVQCFPHIVFVLHVDYLT